MDSKQLLSVDNDSLFMFGAFALAAFVIKLFFLYFSNTKTQLGRSAMLLCTFLAIQNACEFLGYFLYTSDPILTHSIIDVYMMTTYFIAGAILVFSFDLVYVGCPQRTFVLAGAYGIAFGLMVLHLSGQLVYGYKFNGYSLVRIPAAQFYLAEIFIIGCAAASIYMPVKAAIRGADRSVYVALFGLPAYCLAAITVTLMLKFGVELAGAVLFPVASTIFMLVVLLSSHHKLFVVYETEIVARFKLLKLSLFGFGGKDLDHHKDEIEKIYLHLALKRAQNCKTKAGETLGISRSTVAYKMKKHGME